MTSFSGVNASAIAEGVTTFVAAIVCSDAIKELANVIKPATGFGLVMVKIIIALAVVAILYAFSQKYPREGSLNTATVYPEFFRPRLSLGKTLGGLVAV